MSKLIIKFQGKTIGEVNLKLGETTIGRHAACDVVLSNDKSVSNNHAVIKTVGTKSTLEDLGSTNGTYMESERIKRHELRHGASIIIGEHELIYRENVVLDTPAFVKGLGVNPAAASARDNTKTMIISMHAQLVIVEGKDQGKNVPLVKAETIIENPGKNPARIYRGPDGYVIHAQLGPGEPRINGKPVPPGGQILENEDIIEVAGAKFQVVK